MEHRISMIIMVLSLLVLLLNALVIGCASTTTATPPPLTTLQDIDSFSPVTASQQACEVVYNNAYQEAFFEQVFARLVAQCEKSTSPNNADIIWDNFVQPVKHSGSVPPDVAVTLWNYYFSNQFVSLPSRTPVSQSCYRLADIKKNLEKEYQLKTAGFRICQQGSPDSHFLNAMYVYNTLWSACNGSE